MSEKGGRGLETLNKLVHAPVFKSDPAKSPNTCADADPVDVEQEEGAIEALGFVCGSSDERTFIEKPLSRALAMKARRTPLVLM